MQNERMGESFVPSIREYASHFQIDSRRLGPRQLLMHPGPVNRGVELSGEVIDSPQSLMTEQVASGLVVRMAILYELLASAGNRSEPASAARSRRRAADADRARATRVSLADSLDMRAGEGADLVLRGASCSTRSPGSRAPTTSSSATAGSPSSPPPAPREVEGAEVVEAAGLHAFPAFFDPHVHLRTPGHEHKEDIETGTRSAAAGGYCGVIAMANTEPPVSTAADVEALREGAREGASVPIGFLATVSKAMAGEELTEMAELREAGALGFSDDGLPIRSAGLLRRALQYQRLCGRHDRAPRGGPGAVRRRRHARGGGLRRARPGRRAVGLGVDDDRP